MKTINKYSASSMLIHWAMALIILSMLFLGLSMVQSLAVWQVEAIALHKSFGILALVLVAIRLINKVVTTSPALPPSVPKAQALAAHLTQVGLYASMILMPISGWLMQSADGRHVSFFDLFTLPSLVSKDIELYAFFREAHGLIAYAFLLFIFMHVSAALYHGLIKQDGVLGSMLPGKHK